MSHSTLRDATAHSQTLYHIRMNGQVIIIFLLAFIGCSPQSNKDFTINCFSKNLHQLFQDAEMLMDEKIKLEYGIQGSTLNQTYRVFLIDVIESKSISRLDINADSKRELDILKNLELRTIWRWSLPLGDTVTLITPYPNRTEAVLNQLRLNMESEYCECLYKSEDSLIVQFLDMRESIDNISDEFIAEWLLNAAETRQVDDKVLKQLIILNLYLNPLMRYSTIETKD